MLYVLEREGQPQSEPEMRRECLFYLGNTAFVNLFCSTLHPLGPVTESQVPALPAGSGSYLRSDIQWPQTPLSGCTVL